MIANDKRIYALIACLLSYGLAGIFVFQHLVDESKHYIYEDVHQATGVAIISIWLTWAYYKGITFWTWTLGLHLWNWFAFCMLIDSINCAIVYNEYFPYEFKANKALNDNLVYFNAMLCGGVLAVINFVIFCLIAPNIPRWLHSDK